MAGSSGIHLYTILAGSARPACGKVSGDQAFIICSYCSMNETPRIPSPIPYLMQVPDLRAHNTTYDWRMLFMPVLMALGSGRTNVLAIAQWVEDQRDWLLALGFGRRKTATALPAQATIYRFSGGPGKGPAAMGQGCAARPGSTPGRGLLEVSLDGKHLKGSARGGVGDKAIVLVFAYLSRLQSKAAGDEAAAGRGLMMGGGGCSGRGQDSLGAAQTAQVVLQEGGTTSSIARTIRPS